MERRDESHERSTVNARDRGRVREREQLRHIAKIRAARVGRSRRNVNFERPKEARVLDSERRIGRRFRRHEIGRETRIIGFARSPR
jgi:hypothetical protein